jgi:hypothetical protein
MEYATAQRAKTVGEDVKTVWGEIGLPLLILAVMVPLYFFSPLYDHITDDGICRWDGSSDSSR